MIRAALIFAILAVGACAAAAGPSGPPPAPRLLPATVQAGPDCGGPAETGCMLDAAWQAASLLPADKQARLKPAFAEIAAGLKDEALASRWQMRLGAVRAQTPAPDYARTQAEAAIGQYGWEGFFQRARSGEAPLNMGRPEIMGAAISLAPNAGERLRLIDMMFSFAGAPKPGTSGRISPDAFERASFGHVLAEQMMKDCDASRLRLARQLTSAPDAIRYQLWQARVEGNAGALAARIRGGDGTDDTTFVRQVLEGYGPVIRLGYCPR